MTTLKPVKSFLEGAGSTADLVLERLFALTMIRLGLWPWFWQVLLSETTAETRQAVRDAWSFVALGANLAKLFDDRYALHWIPEAILARPKETWLPTHLGAAKNAGAGNNAAWTHKPALMDARTRAWTALQRNRVMDDVIRLQTRFPGLTLAGSPPMYIFVMGAGGSTGHGVALAGAIEETLETKDSSTVSVLLVGPRCGSSFDGHRTEGALTARALLSLQAIADRHPGRLWAFHVDGTDPSDYATVVDESAALLFDLLTNDGFRRRLLDGFHVSARAALPGEPARFLCRVIVERRAIDAQALRARRAVEELLAALS